LTILMHHLACALLLHNNFINKICSLYSYNRYMNIQSY
jgi:hypothetical protein